MEGALKSNARARGPEKARSTAGVAGVTVLAIFVGLANCAVLDAGKRPLAEIADTTWRLTGTGRYRSRVLTSGRWRGRSKHEFDSDLLCRFNADGSFEFETFDKNPGGGALTVTGFWSRKNSKVVFELTGAVAPTGNGTRALVGVQTPPGAREIEVTAWRMTGKLKRSRDGLVTLICKTKFKVELRGPGTLTSGTAHLFTGSLKAVAVQTQTAADGGNDDDPPRAENHPPVVQLGVQPSDGVIFLRDGAATVVLDGRGSTDGDGGVRELLFRWSRDSGPRGDIIGRL